MAVAYPFIEVIIKPPPAPLAQRSPGVVAIVGKSADGAAAVNTPQVVDTLAQAKDLFGDASDLYHSLSLAMLQDPRPSKFYGVKAAGDDYAAALGSLEAFDDVTLVSLANVTDVGAPSGAAAATGLHALKEHVENMSAQGSRRIGVAMIDPSREKSPTYVADVDGAETSLKSDTSRMILIAARGADTDVASAAMAAIAGYEPQISMVLKQIRGVKMPKEKQYNPTEIKGLSEKGIIPIIDPTLIPGEGLFFAEGQLYTTNANLPYIDLVRTLDDVEFRLKAGLIGAIGDARITKEGMTSLKARVEGILGPVKRRAEIDDFSCSIEVLNILNLPETTWSAADHATVENARATRTVEVFVSITYGPAVHLLSVTLETKF